MTRKDIEKKALNTLNSFDVEYIYHKDYASKESFCEGFVMGAEWMDEQHTKVCVMETSNTDNVSDNDLIEECKRRGIFVKLRNEMIEKAYKEVRYILNNELKDNDTLSSDWINDLIEVVAIKLRQEMKGE